MGISMTKKKPKKLFLLIDGTYPDETIVGVYTPRMIDKARRLLGVDRADAVELDSLPPHPRGKLLYRVRLGKHKPVDVRVANPWQNKPGTFGLGPNQLVYVWAKDEAEAFELAKKQAKLF